MCDSVCVSVCVCGGGELWRSTGVARGIVMALVVALAWLNSVSVARSVVLLQWLCWVGMRGDFERVLRPPEDAHNAQLTQLPLSVSGVLCVRKRQHACKAGWAMGTRITSPPLIVTHRWSHSCRHAVMLHCRLATLMHPCGQAGRQLPANSALLFQPPTPPTLKRAPNTADRPSVTKWPCTPSNNQPPPLPLTTVLRRAAGAGRACPAAWPCAPSPPSGPPSAAAPGGWSPRPLGAGVA